MQTSGEIIVERDWAALLRGYSEPFELQVGKLFGFNAYDPGKRRMFAGKWSG